MAVTTSDIKLMISGDPIPIPFPYPLDDRPAGTKWFMAQPDDWIYDMANAVREAAAAQARASKEVMSCAALPPTEAWVTQQVRILANTRRLIADLEAKGDQRLPEEDLELANQRDYLTRLIDPASFNRADEIISSRSRKAFENWLMPRQLQDEQGEPLFDMNKTEDQVRWKNLGRDLKTELTGPFWQAIVLIQSAKNSKPVQNSN